MCIISEILTCVSYAQTIVCEFRGSKIRKLRMCFQVHGNETIIWNLGFRQLCIGKSDHVTRYDDKRIICMLMGTTEGAFHRARIPEWIYSLYPHRTMAYMVSLSDQRRNPIKRLLIALLSGDSGRRRHSLGFNWSRDYHW